MFPNGKTRDERVAELRERIRRHPDEKLFVRVPFALIERLPDGPKDALRTYCLLSSVVGPDGTTRRRKQTLADFLGIDPATLRNSAAWLESEGWLARVGKQGANTTWVVKEVAGFDSGAQLASEIASPDAVSGEKIASSHAVNDRLRVSTRGDTASPHAIRGEHLRGEQPFGLGAPPPVQWSTKDWESVLAAWPGRANTKEARGRFFQLAKHVDWPIGGEGGLEHRLKFLVECYERCGWSLPPLQHVLQHNREVLTDANLDGLDGDTRRQASRRGRA